MFRQHQLQDATFDHALRTCPQMRVCPRPRAWLAPALLRYWSCSCSYLPILSTRAACLPPSNSVVSQTSAIILASSTPITLAPRARTFVSLCCRESLAEYGSLQTTARTPLTLFALIEIPTPVPQQTIPFSHSPRAT